VTDGAGDDRQDLLIADATGAVEDLIPGDRFLLATRNTSAAVEASGGVIYYAQKIDRGWRVLSLPSAPAPAAPARRLAIPPAFFPISVYLGADSAGRTELAYARCHARRRCSPYAFRLPNGPERPSSYGAPKAAKSTRSLVGVRWRSTSFPRNATAPVRRAHEGFGSKRAVARRGC
jgi:hypothetical protein